MRVIILNEDKFYASLLGSATKKLGHSASVLTDIESAMNSIVADGADAILIDLESQGSGGIEFAFDLHRKGLHVLVGFCTGTCKVEELLAMAKNLGPILPKVWTHNDLRTVLKEFQHQLNSQVVPPKTQTKAARIPAITLPLTRIELAEKEISELDRCITAVGTGQSPAFQTKELQIAQPTLASGTGARAPTTQSLPADQALDLSIRANQSMSAKTIDEQIVIIEDEPETETTEAPDLESALQAVSIVCKAWGQLERLCRDMERGKKTITVRSRNVMEVGQEVEVSLELPDCSIVPILARILRVQPVRADGLHPYQLELIGLSDAQIKYLLGRVKQAIPQESPVRFRDPTHAHTIESMLPPVRQARGTAAKNPPTRAERLQTVQYPIDLAEQELTVQEANAPVQQAMPAPVQKTKAPPIHKTLAMPTQAPARRAQAMPTQAPPLRAQAMPAPVRKAKSVQNTMPMPMPAQPPARRAKAMPTQAPPVQKTMAMPTQAPARRTKAMPTQAPPVQKRMAMPAQAPVRRAAPPPQRAKAPVEDFDPPTQLRNAQPYQQPLPTPESIPSTRDALTPAPYEDDVKISWGKPGS